MNISRIKNYKNTIAAIMLASGVAMTVPCLKTSGASLPEPLQNDEFVVSPKTEEASPDTIKRITKVSPKGTTDSIVLENAPNPHVKIAGKEKTALFVVDISKNVLYHYNKDGKAICAYSIASGKPSTPTHKGYRYVSHVETYPYKSAPASTKRRNNPKAFGPKAIIIDKLDPKTGERTNYGEFIHGNNDSSSIGKYASKGCMRMDNEVIKELSTVAQRGDIVVII